MDVQEMTTDSQSWPKQRVPKPKRQRGRKGGSKTATQETKLLAEDQNRARWERKLVQDTTARLRHIDAALIRESEHLFRNKTSLSISQRERERDDRLRRAAVQEVMEAREKAGIEPAGESVLWAGDNIDITNELKRKFGKEHFKNLAERTKARKYLREYLEWALLQPNCGGIASERIEWIRSLLNDTVRLADGSEVIPRMQAVYYIAACCQVAGVPLIEGIEDLAGNPSVEVHNWLMEQEPAFFEEKNFALELGYVLDLDSEGMSKESAQEFGRTANNPIEPDDDDEVPEKLYDEEEEKHQKGKEPNEKEKGFSQEEDYGEESKDEDDRIKLPIRQ